MAVFPSSELTALNGAFCSVVLKSNSQMKKEAPCGSFIFVFSHLWLADKLLFSEVQPSLYPLQKHHHKWNSHNKA